MRVLPVLRPEYNLTPPAHSALHRQRGSTHHHWAQMHRLQEPCQRHCARQTSRRGSHGSSTKNSQSTTSEHIGAKLHCRRVGRRTESNTETICAQQDWRSTIPRRKSYYNMQPGDAPYVPDAHGPGRKCKQQSTGVRTNLRWNQKQLRN